MSKRDESHQREITEALKIGQENFEYIKNAESWCKHFRIKMVSYGLFAQISGLPIGGHSISCQHAEGCTESMNLSRVIPEFILEYCTTCPYHEPNGNEDWGKTIIENHQKQVEEQEKARKDSQIQLAKVKARLRELSNQAQKNSEIDEKQILVFIEQLFEVEELKRPEIVEILVQSAKIGADLFSPVAIDLLCEQSLSEEYSSSCLPICIELASHRKDLSECFKNIAFKVIEQNLDLELAAGLLVNLGSIVQYPLEAKIIKNIIEYQKYYRYIGISPREIPSYPKINQLLLFSYDALPKSVVKPLHVLLDQGDEYIRVNTCGVIKSLQKERPQIGLDLLSKLFECLDLPLEDSYGDSADSRVVERIIGAFRYSPEFVDNYLLSEMQKKRPAVQELYIRIYSGLIRDRNRKWKDKDECVDEVNISSEEQIGIDRCWEFIQDESLEIDVRYTAVDYMNRICLISPQITINYFDSLLGYYALISSQEKSPPPTVKILLPGQEYEEEPSLKRLNEDNRQQKWNMFKNEVLNCIKELVKYDPINTGEAIINCYNHVDTKNHKYFKSSLVDLLGEIGKNYSMKPKILPFIMRALTDFESQLIRAKGIRAIEEMYRYGESKPPKNVVDFLIISLEDQYTIIHKSVIQAFGWNSNWLNREQAIEALNVMIDWLYTYKDQPYQFKDICEAVINVSRRWKDFQNIIFKQIDNLLPTNEKLVDESIIERMLYSIEPDDELVSIISVRQIAFCLGNYSRDHYNSYDDSRRLEMFQWLHKISYNVYLETKSDLLKSAKKLAEKDSWESCYFTSLFAQFGDYVLEREILEIALNSISGEKRYEQLKERLDTLNIVATANIHLQNGNYELVTEAISEIKEL